VAMTVDILDVPALDVIPSEEDAPEGWGVGSGYHPRGWPTIWLLPSPSDSTLHSLSSRMGLSKGAPWSMTLKRPTTGQLSLKKAPDVHLFNDIEILDYLPLNKDRREFVWAGVTMSGDISSVEYTTTPNYMMETCDIWPVLNLAHSGHMHVNEMSWRV
jgi:hypothetical protein